MTKAYQCPWVRVLKGPESVMRSLIRVTFALAISWSFAATQVLAQGGATPQQGAAELSFFEYLISWLPMFILVWFIFYVLVVRPQERKVREQGKFLGELKKGETVVTSSGIIGRVAGIEKETILLELSPGVKARFESKHVLRKHETEKEPATSKKGEAKA